MAIKSHVSQKLFWATTYPMGKEAQNSLINLHGTMTEDEKFEFLKAAYFNKVEKHIKLLKETSFNDLSNIGIKLKIAGLRFAAVASSVSLSDFLLEKR